MILWLLIGLLFLGLIIAWSGVKILREYERGIIFRLGRLLGARGPGIFFIIPLIDTMVKVDLRVITMDILPQDVITKDNVPIKVDAVLYFKISDSEKAVVAVRNYMKAVSLIAQTTLRGVVGSVDLDTLLAEREKVDTELHRIIDKATDPWGIKVESVEVKHVVIPKDMQRAIARQAEAERSRRSKIILAEGEYQASVKLKDAGDILKADPITLRYLQTIGEAAKEPNTTIIFPAEMIGLIRKIEK